MQTITYTIQKSICKTVGYRKRWDYEYEEILVDVSDEVAAFLKIDDKREQRYQWKIKKQKQDAKIYTEFSLDELIQPNDGTNEEFPIEEIIADVFHPENFDPLEIVLEKEEEDEFKQEIKKANAEFDKLCASKMTKKQYEVWKYHTDGHSNVEIAEILSIDESSVRARLKGALKRFKQILESVNKSIP